MPTIKPVLPAIQHSAPPTITLPRPKLDLSRLAPLEVPPNPSTLDLMKAIKRLNENVTALATILATIDSMMATYPQVNALAQYLYQEIPKIRGDAANAAMYAEALVME